MSALAILTKCPLANCPLANCPLANCRLTKCPLANCHGFYGMPLVLLFGNYRYLQIFEDISNSFTDILNSITDICK